MLSMLHHVLEWCAQLFVRSKNKARLASGRPRLCPRALAGVSRHWLRATPQADSLTLESSTNTKPHSPPLLHTLPYKQCGHCYNLRRDITAVFINRKTTHPSCHPTQSAGALGPIDLHPLQQTQPCPTHLPQARPSLAAASS